MQNRYVIIEEDSSIEAIGFPSGLTKKEAEEQIEYLLDNSFLEGHIHVFRLCDRVSFTRGGVTIDDKE